MKKDLLITPTLSYIMQEWFKKLHLIIDGDKVYDYFNAPGRPNW